LTRVPEANPAGTVIDKAPAKRRRLKREERHAQLLSCALEVFARTGVSRASHQDVAREAGTSTPTVFFYFPTRRDLTDAVLSSVEDFMMRLVEAPPSGTSPRQAFMMMADAFIDSDAEGLLKIKIWLDWSTSFRDVIRPRFLALQERILARERGMIEQGRRDGIVPTTVSSEDAARMIHGCAHMFALMMFEKRDPKRIRTFFGRLVDSALGLPPAPLPDPSRAAAESC
jgi:TetR/AcrR family hemagglutinin/protease transcriptional regulator